MQENYFSKHIMCLLIVCVSKRVDELINGIEWFDNRVTKFHAEMNKHQKCPNRTGMRAKN